MTSVLMEGVLNGVEGVLNGGRGGWEGVGDGRVWVMERAGLRADGAASGGARRLRPRNARAAA